LLHDGRHAAANLSNLNDNDGLARSYASSWFKTYHTTLDLLGDTLSLDGIISEDKTT
jgi:hypothetical protein